MRGFWFVAWLLAGCGYTVGAVSPPGNARLIHVAPIAEDGIDIDAAALVQSALRRAVARGPSTRLARSNVSDATLRVELVQASDGLAPMADPGNRAAQYRVRVKIAGVLEQDGEPIWKSSVIEGQGEFLSVADAMEALDGARRRALARAAQDAADRLVAGMIHGQ